MSEPDRPALRVAIADDALLLREGIAKVLEDGGIEVVASVGTGDELLEVAARGGLDAAVLDIRMPPSYRDEGIVALEADARAGLDDRRAPALDVRDARVRAARHGRGQRHGLPAEGARLRAADARARGRDRRLRRLGRRPRGRRAARAPHRAPTTRSSRLTERERSVLELMAQGYSNGGIAQTLFLGLKTVETHVRSILQKLDLEESPEHHRRVLAVLTLLGAR